MKNKIIPIIFALVIVIGIVIAFVFGFNLGADNKGSKRLFIQFEESFELADVEQLAKEVFGDELLKVDYADEFKAGVQINVKDASDEQIKALEDKLKEKYEKLGHSHQDEEDTENTEENTENDTNAENTENTETEGIIAVIDVPEAQVLDLVKVYIYPVIITTAIFIIAMLIVYRKRGFIYALILPLISIIGINALYASILLILRIAINEYTIAIGVFVYAMSLIGVVKYLQLKSDK